MFCGKCGAQIDKTTKLCLNCDRQKIVDLYLKIQRRKWIWKQIRRVCLVLLILAVVVTAGLDLFGVIQLPEFMSPKKVFESWSWHPFASPADKYLRDEILPQYAGQEDILTIPVRGYFNTKSEMSFRTFYEIERGPVALLSYVKDDYDDDGKEELLTVSIEAVAPQGGIAEETPLSENMNSLEMRFTLFKFDAKGNVSEHSDYIPISAVINETTILSKKDNQFLVSSAYDRADLIASDEKRYYPITEGNPHCDHIDSISSFIVNENMEIVEDFGISRNVWYDIGKGQWTSCSYYAPLEIEDRESDLYYRYASPTTFFPQGEKAMYDSEKEACEKINELLPQLGIEDLKIEPFSWDTRWENTFLPDSMNENILCAISIKGSPCEKVAEYETAGEMTLTVEKARSGG